MYRNAQGCYNGMLRRSVAIALFILVGVPSLVAQQFSVASAERTLLFGTLGSHGAVRPSDDQTVVLVVTLKGFSPETWDKLNPGSFSLSVGDSRFNCRVKMSGKIDADGKVQPDYRLVFVVPKTATKLGLHLKEEPRVEFQASASVKPNIR